MLELLSLDWLFMYLTDNNCYGFNAIAPWGLGDVGALVFVTYSYIADRIRFKSMKAHRNAFNECISEWGGPHRVRPIPVLGSIFHQFEQIQIRVIVVP